MLNFAHALVWFVTMLTLSILCTVCIDVTLARFVGLVYYPNIARLFSVPYQRCCTVTAVSVS